MYEFAKKHFDLFIKSNFDLGDEKIFHKLRHTYYVVDNAKYICEDMNLNKEDTEIALVIALLHDIGRFSQAKEMQSFREDLTKYDHAISGAKFLFELGNIRKFVETDKFDKIIELAISDHSQYILDETNLSEREIMHCKIIRDADKIDSFRAKTVDDIFTMANIHESDIENSKITEKIYDDFMNEKTIFSKDRKTGIDIWISYIAFVFGLEFKSSLKLINENNYINKLFDRFNYKKDKDKMELLRSKALTYINDKLNK